MGIAIHLITKNIIPRVHTPDFLANAEYFTIARPLYKDTRLKDYNNLVALAVPSKYWKISGEKLLEMTQAEKDVVDTALPI